MGVYRKGIVNTAAISNQRDSSICFTATSVVVWKLSCSNTCNRCIDLYKFASNLNKCKKGTAACLPRFAGTRRYCVSYERLKEQIIHKSSL